MIWDDDKNGNEWIAASTNERRAEWAEAAVERFREVCSGDNDATAIYDLICNLGHLWDRQMATTTMGDDCEDWSFRDCIETALMHYDAERGEGDDIERAMRSEEG